MSFLKKFTKYENHVPPGVLLPKINIDDKFYKKLDIDSNVDNFNFLRQLCLQGEKRKE